MFLYFECLVCCLWQCMPSLVWLKTFFFPWQDGFLSMFFSSVALISWLSLLLVLLPFTVSLIFHCLYTTSSRSPLLLLFTCFLPRHTNPKQNPLRCFKQSPLYYVFGVSVTPMLSGVHWYPYCPLQQIKTLQGCWCSFPHNNMDQTHWEHWPCLLPHWHDEPEGSCSEAEYKSVQQKRTFVSRMHVSMEKDPCIKDTCSYSTF